MNIIYENAADRYIFTVAESPISNSSAADIATRQRALAKSGAVAVYLGRERVGSMVDCATWPYAHGHLVRSGDGIRKSELRFGAGTAYVGIELTEKGWNLHKSGALSLDDLRVSGGAEGRKRVSIADLVSGTRKYAYSDGAREGASRGAHNLYHNSGSDQPKPKLLDSNDGAVSPYGLADINDVPIAGQAEALENTYHVLGPQGFHEHLRSHHPAVLHAIASRSGVEARPALHAAVQAAIADNGHETSENEREVDSYSPGGMRAAHEFAHSGENETGNDSLRDAYRGDAFTPPPNTMANPTPEAIDRSPNKLDPLYQRYGNLTASRAAAVAVHPSTPPKYRPALARRGRNAR